KTRQPKSVRDRHFVGSWRLPETKKPRPENRTGLLRELQGSDWRQTCSSHGLPMALGLLVRHHELDCQFGEFLGEHLLRLVDDDLTTFSGRHATEDEEVGDVVEVRVMGDRVAEAHPDGFVNA